MFSCKISHRDITYNIVTIDNNTVLHGFKIAKRVNLKVLITGKIFFVSVYEYSN